MKREVSAVTAEKSGRLNSKESRLFSPLTENWEFGLPSGAGNNKYIINISIKSFFN